MRERDFSSQQFIYKSPEHDVAPRPILRRAPSSQEANSQSASGDSPETDRKKKEGAQP